MVQIMIVDDYSLVGEGLKTLIEQEDDMGVTVVSSILETLEHMRKRTIDVILIDVKKSIIHEIESTRQVHALYDKTPILIYSGFDLSPYYNLLVESGISGFLSKKSTREQLITAIRCAHHGETVIPTLLFKQLRRTDIRVMLSGEGTAAEEISINEKEQAILQEVIKGKSNKEVASTLLMSQRAVEYHLTQIFSKLNVRSRVEAINIAKHHGLISEIHC
ncbi:response regulator [Paenibacillus sp. SI8]|uniref:response regulator transcription factor n=1 Tax=unclassified Paenibacillus TaxID=185978 RepID=UPI0034671610